MSRKFFENYFHHPPFGMLMPKRSYAAASGYRYGFNGKENDNDVKGLGNQQDYGMRIYDPRIGKFLSVDPLTHAYPWYTPYQFAGNNGIWAIDFDGLEEFIVTRWLYSNGTLNYLQIQHTNTNKDVNLKVNFRFREVLGKNDDGSFRLGKYLTDQRVVRIVKSSTGFESHSTDKELTNEEEKLVKQLSVKEEPVNPENELWDLTIGKKLYISETPRNTDIMTDMVAEKKYDLIKNLNPEQRFSNMFIIGAAESFQHNNGTVLNGGYAPGPYTSSGAFEKLLSQIKEDGGIRSATITWKFYQGENSTKEKAMIMKGVKQATEYIKMRLIKAGVKNVDINVGFTKDRSSDEGAKISLKRR